MTRSFPPTPGVGVEPHHDFDDDACCIHCGFDGAEWHQWRHNTWEGRAQPEARQPLCTVYDAGTRERNVADFRRGRRAA